MASDAARLTGDDPGAPRPAPTLRVALLLGAAYVATYVALDWVSYLYPLVPFAITPWNPPPGLSIALLTIAGLRYWPAVFIAVLSAELLVRTGSSYPVVSAATSLAFAVGYTVASAMLIRLFRFDPRLHRVRDVVWLVVVAVNGSILIASAYVGLLVLARALAPVDAFDAVLRLWVGDAIGIIVTAPLVMLLCAGSPVRRTEPHERPLWPMAEMTLQALAVIAALLGVFVVGAGHEERYFYLLFLPLIWVCLRHGLQGAVWCLVAIQLGLLLGFKFVQHPPSSVLELQALMLAIAITGLMLGAAVTERQNALLALGAREAELRTVVATAPDAILALDPDGIVTAANPAAESMFGTSRARITGAPLSRFVDGDVPFNQLTRNVEVVGRRSSGEAFPAEISFSRTIVDDRPLHIGVVRDVSERNAMREHLRERERTLDRAMRLASAGELASALAHELNQPLAAIANYVRACKLMLESHSGNDDRLADTMNRAVTEVTRAGNVVRRLREYFRSGASRLEPIDPQQLVAAVREQWLERARTAGIVLETTAPASLASARPPLLADRVQIEIVLHNLISNAFDAVAAIDTGERRIAMELAMDGPAQLRVTVRDNGPGVPAQLLELLFKPFETSKPAGMGLGLAISRSIVENHGGRLWAEPLTQGVAFHFTLPAGERATVAEVS